MPTLTERRLFLAATAALPIIGGCGIVPLPAALTQSIEKRREIYASFPDKAMLGAFVLPPEQGKEDQLATPSLKLSKYLVLEISPSAIFFNRYGGATDTLAAAQNKMASYASTADRDEFAQQFISVAKSRGNTVKLYKNSMSGTLNRLFRNPAVEPGPDRIAFLGSDPALVEWSPSGRIVSFLTRAHQAKTTIGTGTWQYAMLYAGEPNASQIENNIRNSVFADNEIRAL